MVLEEHDLHRLEAGCVRILHVVASYLPAVRYGGTIVSVHGLCRALAERGHDVHVFTTSVDGVTDSPVAHETPVIVDGVRVWYFRSPRFRRLYWAPALQRVLREQIVTFDLVHTHAVYLWPGWAAMRRAEAAAIPYIVSPRGMLEKDLIERKSTIAKSVLIGFIERYFLEHAAAIHVTSRRESAELRKFGFALPPVYEIPNGVDTVDGAGVMADLLPKLPCHFALFIGRISWKKGLDRLVDALPMTPRTQVVVAGNDDEGYTGQLRARAERLGVADRVLFVGPIYGPAKSALLARASYLILPSYSENFGNVVLEALAHGTPVIMTRDVGAADWVQEHAVAVVTDGSPEALASAMTRLDNDAAARLSMGTQGKALVTREFQWPAVAARVESMYQAVLAKP
jgi:glycosyltransferase involved in cell wall biosynthesis